MKVNQEESGVFGVSFFRLGANELPLPNNKRRPRENEEATRSEDYDGGHDHACEPQPDGLPGIAPPQS